MTEDNGVPGYRGQLNDQCVTIAEVLRAGTDVIVAGNAIFSQRDYAAPIAAMRRAATTLI